jgi:hypothetical protein
LQGENFRNFKKFPQFQEISADTHFLMSGLLPN